MLGQQLVNQSWTAEIGTPISDLEWSATISDAQGYIYSTGHNVVSFDEVELLLVKKNRFGTTIWEQTFSYGTGTKSYGIDLQLENNKLYVIGATYNPTNGNHDYLLLTYNTSGTLIWNYTYNAPANGDDIPSSLVVLTNGYIYITGVSFDPVSDYDYLTICVAPSGALFWDARYDHNNLKDGAAVVKYVSGSGVVVTGASEALTDQWDYASVMYDVATGNQLYEKRKSSGIVGLDAPLDFAVDNAGFIYLTGSANPSGGDNDIYTLKMDDELEVIWEQYHDGYGNDDEGRSITIDAAGNVYVCGYFAKASGANYVLIKYDTAGTVEWQRERSAVDADKDCICDHVTEDNSGNLVLTGREKSSATIEVKTLAYDPDGQLLWEKIRTPNGPVNAYPTELVKTPDGVLVTAQNNNQGTGTYELIKYKTYDYAISYDYDSLGNAVNVDREIIIRFNPQMIDTAFADDPNMIFGTVDEIITSDSLISQMDQVLGSSGTRVEDWVMYKQYPFLNTSNRTITSRYGEEHTIPSIWATYLLMTEGSVEEEVAADTLTNFSERQILYATPNYVLPSDSSPPSTDPNDEYYQYQAALHPVPGFLNADINIAPAWVEAVGDPGINVGLIDSGINFNHPEFGSVYEGLGGSVVVAGYNFLGPNAPVIYDDNDGGLDLEWPHGTRLAGIIGALRNNNMLGISGIAGGDIDNNQSGVRMTIYRSVPTTGFGTLSPRMEAMAFAATQGGITGPQVDILNNSYGQVLFQSPEDFLTDAIYPAHKAGIIILASRGNISMSDDSEHYPATLSESMIISVGGSGTDGRLKNSAANSSGNAKGEDQMSKFGKEMDIIAPATSNLIVTTNNEQPIFQLEDPTDIITCDMYTQFGNNENYCCFNGTSSATAMASGVSALLLEKHEMGHGITLAHEDVERLLEYGATPLDPGTTGAYTDQNGWGRLNAGASMNLIVGDQKVVHFQVRTDRVLEYTLDPIKLDTKYEAVGSDYNGTGIFPVFTGATGNMVGNIYKYTYDININFCTEFNGATIVDPGISVGKDAAWILNSRSNLFGERDMDNVVQAQENVSWLSGPTVSGGCTLQGTLVGYTYEIYSIDTESLVNDPEIIPNDGRPQQMWFSVLINDPNDSITEDELIDNTTPSSVESNENTESRLNVYPNPTNGQLNVELNTQEAIGVDHIELYSFTGKLLRRYKIDSPQQNFFEYQINTDFLSAGLYTIKLSSKMGNLFSKSFIKK